MYQYLSNFLLFHQSAFSVHSCLYQTLIRDKVKLLYSQNVPKYWCWTTFDRICL